MARIDVTYLELTNEEIVIVRTIASRLMGSDETIPLHPLLDASAVLAQELPARLRTAFYSMKLHESAHAICVRGDSLYDPKGLPPTPSQHRSAGQIEVARLHDVIHVLFSSLLGEPFSWTSIQNGYIINDIMPVAKHVNLVASSGYAVNFDLHTEDAFHPCAGDYIGLMCLRNPTRVPTVLACLPLDAISASSLKTLFEYRYVIGANVAQEVQRVIHGSPVLWGNRKSPYLRINLNATHALTGDSEGQQALNELMASLRSNAVEVVFQPGDFWYIDNYRVAHGRGPFEPSFGGEDRWLRRLYISSCFRRSAPFRRAADDRVLEPGAVLWSYST